MKTSLRAAVILLASLVLGGLTTSHIPDLPELAREASGICVGRVEAQHTRWDADHRLILTDTTVRVSRWLKGSSGPTITITEVGGTLSGTTLENPARATFQDGGTYLLFLTPRATGGTRTLWGPLGRVTTTSTGFQQWPVPHTGATSLTDVVQRVQAAGVRP